MYLHHISSGPAVSRWAILSHLPGCFAVCMQEGFAECISAVACWHNVILGQPIHSIWPRLTSCPCATNSDNKFIQNKCTLDEARPGHPHKHPGIVIVLPPPNQIRPEPRSSRESRILEWRVCRVCISFTRHLSESIQSPTPRLNTCCTGLRRAWCIQEFSKHDLQLRNTRRSVPLLSTPCPASRGIGLPTDLLDRQCACLPD